MIKSYKSSYHKMNSMKITDIQTTLVFAYWRNWTFVQVFTDQGIVGLGEATLRSREHAVVGAIEDMSRYLIGQDPLTIQSHFQTLYKDFHHRGGAILMTAISGIEIALWDILGQYYGIPIYQFLGGKLRDRVWAYANGWFEGVVDEDELVRCARQAVEDGFSALKWNPFSGADGWMSPQDMRKAIRQIGMIREAVGDNVELMLEAHGLFTPAMAIRLVGEIEPYRPFWLEEPVPPEDIGGLAFVHSRSAVPIASGERLYSKYQFADLIEQRAVDILQPDVQHAGGLMELRLIAAMGETRYMGFAPHNSSSPVGTAASLHLDACVPNFLIQELPVGDVPWREEIVEPPIEQVTEGFLNIPTAPGLGVRLNEKVARQHPYQNPDLSALDAAATPESQQLGKKLSKKI